LGVAHLIQRLAQDRDVNRTAVRISASINQRHWLNVSDCGTQHVWMRVEQASVMQYNL
jgi:hypothetical protein